MTTAGSLVASGTWQVMVGPFDAENAYLATIPANNELAPEWVKSLYERDTKDEYCAPDALNQIGMPVGGLLAGTVYLSGDGRL